MVMEILKAPASSILSLKEFAVQLRPLLRAGGAENGLEQAGPFNRLALALFHAGELEAALKQFEESIILTPDYLMAHYHMGVTHERRGEMEAAERAFEYSEDHVVGEVSSLFHLAVLRRAQGDTAAAMEYQRRAREFGQVELR